MLSDAPTAEEVATDERELKWLKRAREAAESRFDDTDDDSEQTSPSEDGDTRITDHVTVEDNGIRIICPRCDQPNVVERSIDTGTYAECAWDDCDAIITYRVTVEATAVDSRDTANQFYEESEGGQR